MRLLLMVCTLVVLAATETSAQPGIDGSIRGYVKDEQGAVLPGATVTAASATGRGTHTAVTDQRGYYRLIDLPADEYAVGAELQGFARAVHEQIVVRAGLNLGVNIVMKVGTVSDTVSVVADPPLLERFGAEQAVNIDGEFQRSLPLAARRNWSDFFLLTPGVVNRFGPTADLIYVNGGNLDSQVMQIDGADVSPPSSNGVVFSFMSSEVIDDVQVKTSGAPASAPLGQAAIVNIASRSGTNILQGVGHLLGQRQNWASNNNPTGTTAAFGLQQTDLSIGGPIVRNAFWFFGTYRQSHLNRGVSRTAAQLATLRALEPAFEPFEAQTSNHQGFAKLNARLSGRHQLSGFYQYGKERAESGGGTDAAPFVSAILGGHSASVRLSSTWSSRLNTRVNVAYNTQAGYTELARYDIPGLQVYATALSSGGRLVGNTLVAALDNLVGTSAEMPNKQLTITADAGYHLATGLGLHAFEAGMYLQPLRRAVFRNRYAANGFAFQDARLRDPANPSLGAVIFHQRIFDTDRFTTRSARVTDYAFYVQDLWQLTDRLTLTPGVRVDRLEYTDQIFDRTFQRSTAVGPRFGVAYALTDSARDMLRFYIGRTHDAVAATGALTSVGSASPGIRDLYDLDANGTFETVFLTPPLTVEAANRHIELEGYRQPHVDEIRLAYQRQFPSRITTEAGVLRRTFRDNRALVEINGIYENGVFRGYRDESATDIFQPSSNVWNWPVYTALQLQVARNARPLQVIASYVRQWRHLAGTWQPNDPASFIQPEAFANNRGIGPSSTDLGTNSLSGTAAVSGSSGWRDHVVRIAAAYQGKGFHLAGSYVLESGRWSGPIITRVTPDPRFGPATLRLSNGRVVSNPLATPFRFAFPTRGEGQFTTPWLSTLNLQVGREFRLGRIRLEPGIDVLNLLNAAGDQDLVFGTGANQTFSANYRVAGNRQPPRQTQVSLRITF